MLVTHSRSGGMGWTVAMKNPRIRAVVSYEPGSGFVFPGGEVPPAMPSATGPLEGIAVPKDELAKLTRIPIDVCYRDNIPIEPSKHFGEDNWRVRLAMARLWTEVINRHGGNATLVHLPDTGVRGNAHFPSAELNNFQIADLMSAYLAKIGLDWPRVRRQSASAKRRKPLWAGQRPRHASVRLVVSSTARLRCAVVLSGRDRSTVLA